jgi:hypothetical protein
LIADLNGSIVDYDIIQSRADYGDGLFRTDVKATALGLSGNTAQIAHLRGWRISLTGNAFSDKNIMSMQNTIYAIGLDNIILIESLSECLRTDHDQDSLVSLNGCIILESVSIHPQMMDQSIQNDIETALHCTLAGQSHAVINTPLSRMEDRETTISIWDGQGGQDCITHLNLNTFRDDMLEQKPIIPTHVPCLHVVN